MTELVNLSETTVVKAGSAFCVALRDGRLPVETDHPLGLYLDDCRHLRGHELRLGGRLLRLLASSDAPGSGGVFELTNPDLGLPGGGTLKLQSMRVRLERRIFAGMMAERIVLRSFSPEPVELDLELELDADFRTMMEIRGLGSAAPREGRRHAGDGMLRFSAIGLDDCERSTEVLCDGAAARPDGRLIVPLALGRGEEQVVEVRFSFCRPGGEDRSQLSVRARPERDLDISGAAAEADAWLAERPRVEVDDQLIDSVLRRSLLDLRLLGSDLDGLRYNAAGVPWYATLFGR